MICGIELFIKIPEKKADWLCNKFNLFVKRQYNSKQERLIHDKPNTYLREGTHRHLVIEVRRSGNDYSLTLRGSIHKFYHGNNKGFFAGCEIMKAKHDISTVFQLDPHKVRILNLEVGINVPVWVKYIYHYLQSNLLYHKKKTPEVMPKAHKTGFIFKHEDYLLKFYCKAANLLRYELKITSVKILKDVGLEFFSDVAEEPVNNLIADYLLPEFLEVIMANGLNIYKRDNRIDLLPPEDRESLLEFTSQLFINGYNATLKEADKAKKDSMRQYNYRLKKKCIGLIRKYGNGDNERLFDLMCCQVEDFINSWKCADAFTSDVTFSAIFKDMENVTEDISNIKVKEECPKVTKQVDNLKSKKQVAKEKINKDKKLITDFHALLATTLKKIAGGAA